MKHLFSAILFIVILIPGFAFGDERAETGSDKNRPRMVMQLGHTDSVISAAFSPDGASLLSGGWDKSMILWDIRSGRMINIYRGHKGAVSSVAFSPKDKYAASGGRDGTVRIWDLLTGRGIRTIEADHEGISAVVFSKDGRFIFSAGSFGEKVNYEREDYPIKQWDVESGKVVRVFSGHRDYINSLALNSDGSFLLSSGNNGTLRIWDTKSGGIEKLMKNGGDLSKYSVISAAFSPNGKQIIAKCHGFNSKIGKDGFFEFILVLWDVEKEKVVRKFKDYTGAGNSVAFSSDGKYVISEFDKGFKLYDVQTGKAVRSFSGHSDYVLTLAASIDARYVITGGADRVLKLWDVTKDTPLVTFQNLTGSVNKAAFSPGDHHIFAESVVWETATGRESKWLEQLRHFSRDGKYAITEKLDYLPDGEIIFKSPPRFDLWDMDNQNIIKTLEGLLVFPEELSPDGQYGLFTTVEEGIEVDSLETDDSGSFKKKAFLHYKELVRAAAFSYDGKYILTGNGSYYDDNHTHELKLWDIGEEKDIKSFIGHTGGINAVAFSPGGHHVISGSGDMTLKLWNIDTGEEVRTFSGHTDEVTAVAFSRDGKYILSGGRDKIIKLWETETGAEVKIFSGHAGAVTSLAFSYNEKYILSGGENDAAMIWDIQTGQWLCMLAADINGTWIVVDSYGRFDTNNLEEIKGIQWIMPDDPLRPLPLEIFMRDYYEPRLLPRILNGEAFKPVPALQDLNRVQPEVKIVKIESPKASPDKVAVTVEVSKAKGEYLRGDKKVTLETGVSDLRLFRDGQLVGYEPQKGGEVKVDEKTGKSAITFSGIRLPRDKDIRQVEFSAYAFNDDRVKSATDRKTFAMPESITPVKGRAYIISVGVNAYENPEWDLQFAANDARMIQRTMYERLSKTDRYDEIIKVPLISDYQINDGIKIVTEKLATKDNFKLVLDSLSGREEDFDNIKHIPNAEKIRRAQPEDLVLISYSSHGDAKDGNFYFFPFDIGKESARGDPKKFLNNLISSEELSLWLKDIDAGEMVMIVDACHSAATVDSEGFKPGPMGSRGLGQLAYDKGMRILTASQADDVALESDLLKQGLLTYSLVHDGIEARQADFKPKDSAITLAEWLKYGVERVPVLYQEVKAGSIKTFGRGDEEEDVKILFFADEVLSSIKKKKAFQQPSLFDFSRWRGDVNLIKAE